MLEYLKNYYVFMLVLMIFSFLVPKEEYKVYIQFFIGIFLIVLLLKPVLELLTIEEPAMIYEVFEYVNIKMENINLEEGGNIYDLFEGERE